MPLEIKDESSVQGYRFLNVRIAKIHEKALHLWKGAKFEVDRNEIQADRYKKLLLSFIALISHNGYRA